MDGEVEEFTDTNTVLEYFFWILNITYGRVGLVLMVIDREQ